MVARDTTLTVDIHHGHVAAGELSSRLPSFKHLLFCLSYDSTVCMHSQGAYWHKRRGGQGRNIKAPSATECRILEDRVDLSEDTKVVLDTHVVFYTEYEVSVSEQRVLASGEGLHSCAIEFSCDNRVIRC